MSVASLHINSVNTHPDLQMRADELLSEEHLADLVEALKERDLPRITCAKVYGRVYVTDGHYRLAAYRRLNKGTIPAEVFPCSWLEAISMAAKANAEHLAKKRTREDKHRAVVTLLNTLFTLGENWSNRKIAEVARVSEGMVRYIAEQHTPVKIDIPQDEVKAVPKAKQAQAELIPQNTPEIPQVRNYAPEHSHEDERYPDDDDDDEQPIPNADKVLGRDGKEYPIPVSDKASTVVRIDFQKLESSLGSLVRLFDDANKVRPKPLLLASVKHSLNQVLSVINQWKKG